MSQIGELQVIDIDGFDGDVHPSGQGFEPRLDRAFVVGDCFKLIRFGVIPALG